MHDAGLPLLRLDLTGTTICMELGSVDITALVRGEKQCGVGDLVGLSHPPERRCRGREIGRASCRERVLCVV